MICTLVAGKRYSAVRRISHVLHTQISDVETVNQPLKMIEMKIRGDEALKLCAVYASKRHKTPLKR